MGRPPKFDRADALQAAMHLFWDRGFDRTSINDLTAAMGISPPSLYATFGDKQALFDAAVELYERSAVVPPALPGCFVISDPTLRARRDSGRDAITRRLRRAQRVGDLPASADVAALTDYVDLVLRGLSALARDGATRRQLRAAADVALRAWPVPASPR